ncbi:hypothetical protein [Chitinophaga sp. HK235]|uniref:hypothetical protein n=1 Tax=Chitinophaga sp. HK235 TaxID=2952571 RepID=UPI001BAB70DA|nr:hypothetical protein [Chitinophaga sp. HK235]
MSFDVSALSNYTKENEQLLVTSSIFNAKTQQKIQSQGNVMTGVKSSEQINRIDTDAVFQAGGSCGFNAQGTTAITQRPVTVGKIKVNEALCPKTLESKYTQKALQIGSRYESIPFEQEYTDKKAARIAAQIEKALWQGDTGSANANLNKFDGLIKLIDAAAGVVAANTAPYIGTPIVVADGITKANVRSIVDAMFLAIPENLVDKEDIEIVCGWDTFRLYILALRDANLYAYDADNTGGEIEIPGTNIKLVALAGLNGTKRLFAFRWSNIFLGVDMLNEEEKWEIFFAKEADEVRFVAEWKTGINTAFPDEVVSFKLI